jgi:16S rRNA (guanine966-N2)-methyltransferase
MRIIAGKAGRMAIRVPAAVTRPTTDFVRQALFSIFGTMVEGAAVLDLYAGSGAVGLEALSRGAASCVFVDEHRKACAVIRENLALTRLPGGSVSACEALTFLKRDRAVYDLVYADPPYFRGAGDTDQLGRLLQGGWIVARLSPGGWFVAEVAEGYPLAEAPGLELADRRRYGGSLLLCFRKRAEKIPAGDTGNVP